MQTQAQTQHGISVPLSMIVQGRNPRTFFDPKESAEMEASVKAQGVLQPILLRPLDDGKLQIVAGERRWRAATAVGLADIPALIREMTDEEADAAALIENTERTQMSPTEEAEAASRILGRCSGDRDEAARVLGWSRQTLDKRLALMNCAPSVRKALNERKVSLGHAELLAAVTKEKQDKVLEKLLAAPSVPTIPQLKSMLEQMSQNLDSAIFEKDECVGCPHNSGTQQALFGEAIAGAKCTNGSCYQQKTEGALNALAEKMKDEFPTIKIVRPGENFTILKLVAEGNCGVGEEQAKQCRGCAKFGAAVSAIPGSVGNVYRNQCFDPSCNALKVAERIKAEKAEKEAAATPVVGKEGSAAQKTEAKDKAESKKAAGSPKAKVEISQRVKDYRVKIWRKVFKLEAQQPYFNMVLLLTLALAGRLGKAGSSALAKAFGALTKAEVSTTDIAQIAAAVSTASQETQGRLIAGIAASCFEGLEELDIVRLLTFMQTDLGKHWVLNGEYLELLTKSEIQVVAEELGIVAHLGEKFSKIMGGKKDEIIKALLAVDGFDYTGKVPGHLKYAQD